MQQEITVGSKIIGSEAGEVIINRGSSVFHELDYATKVATKQVKDWIPKNKHLASEAKDRFARFATENQDQVREWVVEAINSEKGLLLKNNVDGSFRVVYDFGKVIGTEGQSKIRVIFGSDGKIWNAFPVREF